MGFAPRPRAKHVYRSLAVLAVIGLSVGAFHAFGGAAKAPTTGSGATAGHSSAGRDALAAPASEAPTIADPSGSPSATPTAPAGATDPGWTVMWSPQAAKDGLGAFEGVEDDRANTDPGRKHIYVEGDHYRVDMTMKIHDTSPDRQRNEVKGMRTGGRILEMNKGETWRLTYSMFIPDTLQATTSFTHIMQLKMPGEGSGPILTTSLRRTGNRPTIEVNLFGQALVGQADLAPLQNRWITSTIEFKIADKPDGYVAWKLTSAGRTVVDVRRTGADTFLADRVRPKWGIYRSLGDQARLRDTYLLLTGMQAAKHS
jgi:hypothetical protein